jgi:hypothetical protein
MQVIRFLQDHGGQYGYSTYWVSYRLAFLSHETVILSPQLPYKATLAYTPSDRYPAYKIAVDAAYRPVLVSANLRTLDAAIVERLAAAEISYQRESIGPYTIFYDLSRKVSPEALGLHDLSLPAK